VLTRKEEEVLQFITRHLSLNGKAPTRAEICKAMGFRSRGTADEYVARLEKKGHLHRDRQWGGIRLTGEDVEEVFKLWRGSRSYCLPLAGRIAAGRPIEAISGQDEINIPELLLGEGRYVLKVKGDSMIEAGIFDGDFVVVKHADSAKSGDIVVALIDNNEATLKRYQKKRNGIELQPANPSLKPIIYDPDRIQIQGIVVGSLRMYK